MPYLTSSHEIHTVITELSTSSRLWVDTEVADYQTKKPRLSLIQVLAEPQDQTGDCVYLLDVLDQPQFVSQFVDSIMVNSNIEKVFHNAKYDLKFIGKEQAQNVTCTLEMSRKIPYYLLPVANFKLKTLALHLGNFSKIDKQEQSSDWGQRPLTQKQLDYAKMDLIYLVQVHQGLLQLSQYDHPNPATEDLTALTNRYKEIEHQWKMLDSEITHLRTRIKNGMQAKNISENESFKLSESERKTFKIAFSELAQFVQNQALEFDFPVTLTQALRKQLGDAVEQLSLQIEKTATSRLTIKSSEEEAE